MEFEAYKKKKEEALKLYNSARNPEELKKAYGIIDSLAAPAKELWLKRKISSDELNQLGQYSEFINFVVSAYFYTQDSWDGKKVAPASIEQKISAMDRNINAAKEIYETSEINKPKIEHTFFVDALINNLEKKLQKLKKQP
jgi:hypothetical protein